MRDYLFQPLTWGWLMLAWLGIRSLRSGRRAEGLAALALVALLSVCGGTPLASWCLSRLELPYARPHGSFPAPADAVVMLGGGHSASSWESTGVDANASFDRTLAAWQLVRNGVATNLVLGGGRSLTRAGRTSDGENLASWLRTAGETRASIRVLPDCRTTADEARETAVLAGKLGWKRLVVVTSASHLPRALAAFRSAGVDAEGFGADFRGLDNLEQGRDWSVVPSPGTLWITQRLLHELVGRVWYRATGRG
jgi:uncharacterized SAM-binding protein YcdF (DUF218 family)